MRSEMLENYVALSITNILAMLLLAFVVGRNNLLDRKMKRFFSTAIFCPVLLFLVCAVFCIDITGHPLLKSLALCCPQIYDKCCIP